jgi:hypothetical protein
VSVACGDLGMSVIDYLGHIPCSGPLLHPKKMDGIRKTNQTLWCWRDSVRSTRRSYHMRNICRQRTENLFVPTVSFEFKMRKDYDIHAGNGYPSEIGGLSF